MINSIFVLGLFLIFSDSTKIFVILFSIEILSFFVLLFFSLSTKMMFFFSLLLVVSGGVILTILSLQFLFFFNKNKLNSFLK